MNKKTKIIATIGPASESGEIMERLILEGTDLFRFNLKHNTFEWHKKTISKAKKIANKLRQNLGIIIDFQGPELRIETKNGHPLEIREDETFFLSHKFLENKKCAILNPGSVIKQIEAGDKVYINDGELEAEVVRKNSDSIEIKSNRDYVIYNRKSINIPGKMLDTPLLSKSDLRCLSEIDQLKADFVALSFVRDADDIEMFKKMLIKVKSESKVIAKIENAKAIENLESIILSSDAVMVARGDLGIEVPLMELAYWQKKIIDLSRKYSRPVIVATQMLQSMVNNYNPTRAEATDVANAIFDGTDAVMLSEETAVGRHPIKVVEEMKKITNFCEKKGIIKEISITPKNLTEILVDAAVKIIGNSKNSSIKAIVVFTQSGKTAKVISRYRLKVPIIAITNNEDTIKTLNLSYGIHTYFNKFKKLNFQTSDPIFRDLLKFEFIKRDDTILTIHGNNWMETGSTSDISLVTL